MKTTSIMKRTVTKQVFPKKTVKPTVVAPSIATPLSAVEQIALSKYKADKDAREHVGIGIHNLDMVLHITGSMSVNPDEEYTPTVSIPIKKALALFIKYCGITREAAIQVLGKAMTDALSDEVSANETIEEVESMEKKIQELVGSLPPQIRAGKVSAKLSVTKLR